jgi:acetyltransferase-like isoleucine patch superfamily enzyme
MKQLLMTRHRPAARRTLQHLKKVVAYVTSQADQIHLRAGLAQLLARCLPYGAFGAVRAAVYRRIAFPGICSKVVLHGPLELRGTGQFYHHLCIDELSYINGHCFIDLNAAVHIGKRVTIGHHTIIITSNHEIGPPVMRAGKVVPQPVTIGDGAWIAARVTILPGVSIGPGALVGAGSVVTRDVPAHAKVAGVPARIIGYLDAGEPR